MDYKNALRAQLLSKTNIDFIVNNILMNFKISNKAVNKCINIITNNLLKYLDNLDKYPENNNQLIEAITFLNKKCYDDFTIYLYTKYPNVDLVRNSKQNDQQINNVRHYVSQEVDPRGIFSYEATHSDPNHSIDESLKDTHNDITAHNQYITPKQNIPYNNYFQSIAQQPNVPNVQTQPSLPLPKPQFEEMVIISEDEKNELLKKHEKNSSNSISNDFYPI